ncbi:uncharacterized protein AB675_6033 [Cyphellophora attinorum]|uniref:Uncharacterized protein n=1 Tax=Cyphellophora attinorum TaxID=1664694 RepID=A0A0N1HP31_9EURO|nr:uncharacterized protein AB675_6033 [Phialophora attinorum]KPI36932.1 hypothetical protein AB675_6033 [Phialophora attinorum]
MANAAVTALLIIFALAAILSTALWVSLRHRSRATHAAAAAAEAGRSTSHQQANSPISPTIAPRRGPSWWTTIFTRASNPARSIQRRDTASTHNSQNAESRYLCPAPGQTYALPRLQPHPSIKRARKAPPLVAARSAYRLPPGATPVEVITVHRRRVSNDISNHSSPRPSQAKNEDPDGALSPTHTGADWPLPQALSQPLPPSPPAKHEIITVATSDGNFENIYLEHGGEGARMGAARRVASGHGSGEKPLPDVMEGGHGRHGSFDFERSGLMPANGGGNGNGWRLSWW